MARACAFQRAICASRSTRTIGAPGPRLYGTYFPLTDVPALKDDDLDGRSVRMSKRQLAALNRRFLALADVADPGPPGTFRDQEQSLEKNAKAMQFLS